MLMMIFLQGVSPCAEGSRPQNLNDLIFHTQEKILYKLFINFPHVFLVVSPEWARFVTVTTWGRSPG